MEVLVSCGGWVVVEMVVVDAAVVVVAVAVVCNQVVAQRNIDTLRDTVYRM